MFSAKACFKVFRGTTVAGPRHASSCPFLTGDAQDERRKKEKENAAAHTREKEGKGKGSGEKEGKDAAAHKTRQTRKRKDAGKTQKHHGQRSSFFWKVVFQVLSRPPKGRLLEGGQNGGFGGFQTQRSSCSVEPKWGLPWLPDPKVVF